MNLEQLNASGNIIFECVAGSVAYNLNTPKSDIDLRGIFIDDDHFSLNDRIEQVSDKTNDITYYELRKFLSLARNCNPNIIELLWVPEQHVSILVGPMKKILQNRDMFISKKCYHTFSGYAHNQISKAKGQNKWINNPQPEERPNPKDYLYWVSSGNMYTDASHVDPAFRPVRMTRTTGYKVANLEKGFNGYRVYSTDESHDFMVGGRPKCSPVTMTEEFNDFAGIAVFNDVQYDHDMANHKNYWTWMKNRNDARWELQEAGKTDYDVKNMMHCMRLVQSTRSILNNGHPQVSFYGAEREFLMDIRRGKFEYQYLMDRCETELEELKVLRDKSSIPKDVKHDDVNNLYKEIMYDYAKLPTRV
jgi:predicted nucleotidyltransferase